MTPVPSAGAMGQARIITNNEGFTLTAKDAKNTKIKSLSEVRRL